MTNVAPSGLVDERPADIAAPGARRPPIAVDLDGTLILSDTLHEGVLEFLKLPPAEAIALVRALRAGKAAVKRSVAGRVVFDPAMLPYNEDLLNYLRAERAAGRRIGLFTAADQSIADAVAAHLGLFDVVCGSDGVTNLSGAAKAAAIEARFGPDFTYAGDGMVDMPIFARAGSVILTGSVGRLQASLAAGTTVETTFPVPRAGPAVWLRALRVQHWSKNTLVFVAPVLAMPPLSPLPVLLMFVLFSVLASATYLINDLTDLAADRAHPKKYRRPLACGAISTRDGALAAGALIVATMLASLLLPSACTLVLLAYLVLTLLYSTLLKRIPMIDVTVLAGLFTLRVLAGSLVVAKPVSPWLLTFSMLFFLGLAAIKRYAELYRVGVSMANGGNTRGYTQEDMPLLLSTGVSTGLSSIVIFMVYLIDEQYSRGVYSNPAVLWGIMPILLVWTLRLWHLAVHGRMNEDPVVFALKDRTSLALGGVILLIMVVAHF